MSEQSCIFCKIVSGDAPSYKVWESDTHFAFLSIYPNTEGVTVVIPKKHFSSYAFEMQDEDLFALIKAAKEVALLLDKKFQIGRTAMVFEGFGVDHVHAKLFPLHGTSTTGEWKPALSSDEKRKEYFELYQGYVSSHDCMVVSHEELRETHKKITSL